MSNLIELKNVEFSYSFDESEAPENVLCGVSFGIEKGSFVAIIGPNGSGKSTLAKLLNGLNRPSKGEVLVDSMSTEDESKELEIRKKVGLVFQNPDNQLVTTIVEEDVAFGPENLGLDRKELRQRVDNALKAVGMYEYKDHSTYKLSGGQKQRVAIAGILAMEPECIVLDEPTAMLDPNGRAEVLSTVKRLNREKGITVVLITHFMNEIFDADRLIVLNKGRVLLDGTPSEVFSRDELLKDVGLSLTQSAELISVLSRDYKNIAKGALSPTAAANEIARLLEEQNCHC